MSGGARKPPPDAAFPRFARGRGRPTKLGPDVQEKVCRAIRAGNRLEVAGALAGVHRDTLYDWLKKGGWYNAGVGRDGAGKRVARDRACGLFAAAVEEAFAQAEARHVVALTKAAADGNVKASQWWLERARHMHWGRRDPLPVDEKQGGATAELGIVDELRRAMQETREDHPPAAEDVADDQDDDVAGDDEDVVVDDEDLDDGDAGEDDDDDEEV